MSTAAELVHQSEARLLRTARKYGFAKLLGMFTDRNGWTSDPEWQRREQIVANEADELLRFAEELVRALAGLGDTPVPDLGPEHLQHLIEQARAEASALEATAAERRAFAADLEKLTKSAPTKPRKRSR